MGAVTSLCILVCRKEKEAIAGAETEAVFACVVLLFRSRDLEVLVMEVGVQNGARVFVVSLFFYKSSFEGQELLVSERWDGLVEVAACKLEVDF